MFSHKRPGRKSKQIILHKRPDLLHQKNMYNPFWNTQERRLRFFWRLFLQSLLLLIPFSFFTSLTFALVRFFFSSNESLLSPSGLLLNTLSGVWMATSVIFSVWISGKYFDHRSFQEYGFHFKSGWRRDFIFGLVLGALLMVFIFLIELSAGWIHIDGFFQPTLPGFSFMPGILGALIFFVCVGVYEELWIRGYLLHNLAEAINLKFLSPRIGLLAAYVISSVIFGFLHGGNPNASTVSSVSIAAAGLLLGLGFILTGDLAIPIGIHITWNFFEGNVFGFPVSGISSTATIIHINQTGPLVWTGGAFGPEAGLIGLAAILLGCVLTLAWIRFHSGKVVLQDRLAQFQPITGGGLDLRGNVSPDNYP